MHSYENDEAGEGQSGAKCNEGESKTCEVGQVGDYEAEGKCCSDRGDRMQLGLHNRVAKRPDNGRSKVGVGCGRF